MTQKISEEELEKRVRGYLDRVKKGNALRYPLQQRGTYSLITGSKGERGYREQFAIFQGRFIDAVVYLVQQPDFLGDWCGWQPYDNQNNGRIEKPKIVVADDRSQANKLLQKLRRER
jgi:hypothetical protein